MQPRLFLAEMTREQIRAAAPETTVVLPTASIEQHGPHLPIFTDTAACTTVCQRAAELASAQVSVTIAPPLHFGSSHHHFPHPGVLSLQASTFIQVVLELCESLERSGFRRIAIVNGHGGNEDPLRVAAREFSLTHDATVAMASYWTIARQALLEEGQADEVGRVPGHAGGFETSLILALRPDLVQPAAYPPDVGRQFPPGVADLPAMVARRDQLIGLGPGYTDDPAAASAEHGNRFLDIITRSLADFLVRFSRV
ncbi:MAG: creatininase family protein [Chloroflexi bacterium]|nr:creatininase family protein [Chloroflexota bacterium]